MTATPSSRLKQLDLHDLAVVRRQVLQQSGGDTDAPAAAWQVRTFADECDTIIASVSEPFSMTTVVRRDPYLITWWTQEPIRVHAFAAPLALDPDTRALEEIRDLTGSDWAEIATWLGVSRVSVSNWRSGAEITTANRSRLHRVLRALRIASGRVPNLRLWLQTPIAGGSVPSAFLSRGLIREFEALASFAAERQFATQAPWDDVASDLDARFVSRPFPTLQAVGSPSSRRRPRFREDDDVVLEEIPEPSGG